ncbi:hypothetical protein TL16_g00407 [Triparma laevis f. inornata]|uniref:MBD domain-containing protein n=1 Tax=Triparma laevis f. inornata TaxID=1714386 RepID=A0A9W6ZD76_9STRA|nr:hypothetical protein TL16_g00407 [Triparma laevis f. inornata]
MKTSVAAETSRSQFSSKVVSASKTSTSVVKAASPASHRGHDGSFNLDNDDDDDDGGGNDSDASMLEEEADLFDLEEVKKMIGAQRLDARLSYGFPEEWDVYVLRQRGVVIDYFIETPGGWQFSSLEKAKKYLQSMEAKRTGQMAHNRAKSSKSLKVDRTALTADHGSNSDFNQAADKARLSVLAAPAANATTTRSRPKKWSRQVQYSKYSLSVGSKIRHKTLGHGVITKIKQRHWLRGEFRGKKDQSFRIKDLLSIEGVTIEGVTADVAPTKADDVVGPSRANSYVRVRVASLLSVGTNVRHPTHGNGVVTIVKGAGWVIGEFDGEEVTFRSTELELIEGVPAPSYPTSSTPKKPICEPYTLLSPKEISADYEYVDPIIAGVPRTWRVKRIWDNNPLKHVFVVEARPSGKVFNSGNKAREYFASLNVGVDGKVAHKCANLFSKPYDFQGGLKRGAFTKLDPISFGLSAKWRVVERTANVNKPRHFLSPEGCFFDSKSNVKLYVQNMGGLDNIDKLKIEPWVPPTVAIATATAPASTSVSVAPPQTPQIAGSEIVVVSGFAISASFFTGFIWSAAEDAALVEGVRTHGHDFDKILGENEELRASLRVVRGHRTTLALKEQFSKLHPEIEQQRFTNRRDAEGVGMPRTIGTNVRHPTHGDGVVTLVKGTGWMVGEFDGGKVNFRSTELELTEGVLAPSLSTSSTPTFARTKTVADIEPYNTPLSPEEISAGCKYVDPVIVGVPRTWRVKRIFRNNDPLHPCFAVEARPSGKIFENGKKAREYLASQNVGVDGKVAHILSAHKISKLFSRPSDFEWGLKRKAFTEVDPISVGLSAKWRVVQRPTTGNKVFLSPEGYFLDNKHNVDSYIESMGGLDEIDKLQIEPWVPPTAATTAATAPASISVAPPQTPQIEGVEPYTPLLSVGTNVRHQTPSSNPKKPVADIEPGAPVIEQEGGGREEEDDDDDDDVEEEENDEETSTNASDCDVFEFEPEEEKEEDDVEEEEDNEEETSLVTIELEEEEEEEESEPKVDVIPKGTLISVIYNGSPFDAVVMRYSHAHSEYRVKFTDNTVCYAKGGTVTRR